MHYVQLYYLVQQGNTCNALRNRWSVVQTNPNIRTARARRLVLPLHTAQPGQDGRGSVVARPGQQPLPNALPAALGQRAFHNHSPTVGPVCSFCLLAQLLLGQRRSSSPPRTNMTVYLSPRRSTYAPNVGSLGKGMLHRILFFRSCKTISNGL